MPLGDEEVSLTNINHSARTGTRALRQWKPILAEFVGTCIFAFVTETAAVSISVLKDPTVAPVLLGALVNGFTLVGLIYSLGPVSGAHFNPAVTVGALIAKQVTLVQALFYIIFQILGGLLGTSWVLLVRPQAIEIHHGQLGLFKLTEDVNWGRGLFVEAVTTFILVFVIFCVVLNPHLTVETAASGHIAPLFAPISVGFTVSANIFATGSLTGGCMNPARALGPIIITNTWRNAQVYVAGPIIGGILASVFQRIVFGKNPFFSNYDM